MIWVHRKEQLDLDVKPIVCVHIKKPNMTKRLFCIAIKNGRLRLFK